MTVYLIHLDRKVHHAQHYLGSADDLEARIAEHAASTWEELAAPCSTPAGGVRRGQTTGKGNPLLAYANARGVTWRVARIWPGDRRQERRLKNYKKAPRLCPICSGERAYQHMP